jgi:uncharacterized membrane protein YphA (DoxX/SURF4 family)
MARVVLLCSDHTIVGQRPGGRGLLISKTLLDVSQLLLSQLALFLALLLATSVLHKARQYGRVRGAAAELTRLKGRAADVAVVVAGVSEAAAAVLLCISGMRAVGAWVAAAVIAVYLGFIMAAIATNRRDFDCGCNLGSPRRALGAFAIARNSILVLCGLLVALYISDFSAPSGSELLPAAILLAIYFALDEVIAVRSLTRSASR